MPINFNLNSLGNAQTRAVTGRRRKTPYTLALLAQTPYARQEAAQKKTDAYNETALNQERTQFDRELSQTKTQFDVAQANNLKIAKEQESQAKKAQTIQGVQTGVTLAALTKDAWLPAVKSMLPTSAPTAAVADAAPIAGAEATKVAGTQGTLTGATTTPVVAPAADALGTWSGWGVGSNAAGSAVPAAVSKAAGAVAVPLAIIAAANLARDQWGAPGKKWYGEGSKNSREKFFDDPGMGLGANVVDKVFGEDSEVARIPNQVGENFSHFAGGPISKAFAGDFKGSLSELSTAPETTLQNMGVDKKTSATVNAYANPWGYAYNQIDQGNVEKALPAILAPDPISASLATGIGSSGDKPLAVVTGGLSTLFDKSASKGDKALAVATGGLSTILCFAAGTRVDMANGDVLNIEDVDLDDEMAEGGAVQAIGKAWTDNLYVYRGIKVEGHHAVFDDGRWKRVQDCDRAERCETPRSVVYPIVNAGHLIIAGRIVFADLAETPLGWDVSDAERLAWLNAQADRNADLRRRYADA